MAKQSIKQLLRNHLIDYQKEDLDNASVLRNALKKSPDSVDNDDFIDWCEQQGIFLNVSLLSCFSWMLTNGIVDRSFYVHIYEKLNRVVSRTWNMPIEITTGLDSPLHDGGFLNKEFNSISHQIIKCSIGIAYKTIGIL